MYRSSLQWSSDALDAIREELKRLGRPLRTGDAFVVEVTDTGVTAEFQAEAGNQIAEEEEVRKILVCPSFGEGAGCWHYEDCSPDVESARKRMILHLWPGMHGHSQFTREQAERMTRALRPRSKAVYEKKLARARK